MRNTTRFAPLLVALISMFSFVPAASAAEGGTSVSGSSAKAKSDPTARSAQTPETTGSSDPIVTKTVALTRSQTKSVQRRVKVKPDGALGSRTRKAIKRYQRVESLTLTGAPNVETLRHMGLKIADKLEAKLRAQADGTVATQDVSAPGGFVSALLDAAREAIGTPYRSAGTTLSGFDCSGFTQWAFKKAGVTLPRTSFDQYGEGESIAKDEIQAGDLVFFDSAGSGASHVGIATGPTKVISATTRGVMEHTIASGYWASHYVGARRITAAVKAAVGR